MEFCRQHNHVTEGVKSSLQSSSTSQTASTSHEPDQEPPNKRLKLNQKESTSALETVIVRLVKEGNKLVNLFEYDRERYGQIGKQHVKAVLNEKTKLYDVKLTCLFCGEPRSLATTKYHAVSLSNYKKHLTSIHQSKDQDDEQVGEEKRVKLVGSMVQPTIKELIEKKAGQVNKLATLDGTSVDLTNDAQRQQCVTAEVSEEVIGADDSLQPVLQDIGN